MAEITASFRSGRGSWRDLLRPGIRRAVLVGFSLAVLIHVSGINTVIDYAPAIFRSAGWKIDAALFSTFIVGLTNFSLTIVSFWIIDRYGRRPLYIIGSLGMCAALVALIVTVLTGQFQGVIVLALILAYLAFFCSCVGPVFWTLMPEIFPNNIRGTAMTVSGAHAVGRERLGCSLLPAGLQSRRQSRHFRISCSYVSGAGNLHLVLRPRNQEQTAGRD